MNYPVPTPPQRPEPTIAAELPDAPPLPSDNDREDNIADASMEAAADEQEIRRNRRDESPRRTEGAISPMPPRPPSSSAPSTTACSHATLRRQRQYVEGEVIRLRNQVARVERAEKKALRVAEETRRRANALLMSHGRQETTSHLRTKYRSLVQRSVEEQHRTVSEKRNTHLKSLHMSQQRLILEKRQGATHVRKDRDVIECKLNIQKEESRARQIHIHEAVTSIRERILQKQEEERERRHRTVKEEQQRRIQYDEAVKNLMEKRHALYDKKNAEVMQRLEAAQRLQETESQRLESILAQIRAAAAEKEEV